MKDSLSIESQRVEEDSLYSSKGHFEAAARWGRLHLWLGIVNAALAAVASALAFADIGLWAGILALVAASLAAISTFLNPHQHADVHQSAGNRFHDLRHRARFYREVDLISGAAEAELVQQARSIRDEYGRVREESPPIPRWAYERAKKGIAAGEAEYTESSKPTSA